MFRTYRSYQDCAGTIGPLSVDAKVSKVLQELKFAVEQVSNTFLLRKLVTNSSIYDPQLHERQIDIYMLAVELITETDDLMNIRKHYAGEHASDLSTTLECLLRYVPSCAFSYVLTSSYSVILRDFKAILTRCIAISPKRGRDLLNRAFCRSGKKTRATKTKLTDVLERVRVIQRAYIVCHSSNHCAPKALNGMFFS